MEYRVVVKKGQDGKITYEETYNGERFEGPTPSREIDGIIGNVGVDNLLAIVSNPDLGFNQLEVVVKLSGEDLE